MWDANRTILLQCDTVNSVNIVPNEQVALDRLRVRQNVFLVSFFTIDLVV